MSRCDSHSEHLNTSYRENKLNGVDLDSNCCDCGARKNRGKCYGFWLTFKELGTTKTFVRIIKIQRYYYYLFGIEVEAKLLQDSFFHMITLVIFYRSKIKISTVIVCRDRCI